MGKGSSLAAIKKYIAANNKVDIVKISPFIRKAVKKLVADKKITQVKGVGASGRFKANGSRNLRSRRSKSLRRRLPRRPRSPQPKRAQRRQLRKQRPPRRSRRQRPLRRPPSPQPKSP